MSTEIQLDVSEVENGSVDRRDEPVEPQSFFDFEPQPVFLIDTRSNDPLAKARNMYGRRI